MGGLEVSRITNSIIQQLNITGETAETSRRRDYETYDRAATRFLLGKYIIADSAYEAQTHHRTSERRLNPFSCFAPCEKPDDNPDYQNY